MYINEELAENVTVRYQTINIINPYNCFLKKVDYSVKTSNEYTTPFIIK